jgi:hypothetical protein
MLKKVIFPIFLFLAFFSELNAQQFRLGVLTGLTFSTVSPANPHYGFNPTTHIGYMAGLDGMLAFNSRISILTGLHYAIKGYESNGFDGNLEKYADRFRMNYISLPLALKYRIWNGLSVKGGIEYSRLISLYCEGVNETWTNVTKNLDFRKTDLGVLLGLEYVIHDCIVLSLQDVLGWTSPTNLYLTNMNGEATAILNLRNRSLQFSVGYRFGKKMSEKG